MSCAENTQLDRPVKPVASISKKPAVKKVVAKSKTKGRPIRSHYGNPMHYNVYGKTYEVKKNVIGFKQKGIASWYGKDFHKLRTSSGEPYNMYAMTAAHKTLPLPTYVKVTNLENKRYVVVKVNDRGPFHANRIIDLSYAAARALGMVQNGLAKVTIEAVSFTKKKTNWYLQAGVYAKKQTALKITNRIRSFIKIPVQLIERPHANTIRIGPIADKKLSQQAIAKLRQHGLNDVFAYLN